MVALIALRGSLEHCHCEMSHLRKTAVGRPSSDEHLQELSEAAVYLGAAVVMQRLLVYVNLLGLSVLAWLVRQLGRGAVFRLLCLLAAARQSAARRRFWLGPALMEAAIW